MANQAKAKERFSSYFLRLSPNKKTLLRSKLMIDVERPCFGSEIVEIPADIMRKLFQVLSGVTAVEKTRLCLQPKGLD